jgi:hypothetical protein
MTQAHSQPPLVPDSKISPYKKKNYFSLTWLVIRNINEHLPWEVEVCVEFHDVVPQERRDIRDAHARKGHSLQC